MKAVIACDWLDWTGAPVGAPGYMRGSFALTNKITDTTRRKIIDSFVLEATPWSGWLGEAEFLSRIFDLNAIPSTDSRFSNAYHDIQQHRDRNNDWGDDYLFTDPRFGLRWAT